MSPTAVFAVRVMWHQRYLVPRCNSARVSTAPFSRRTTSAPLQGSGPFWPLTEGTAVDAAQSECHATLRRTSVVFGLPSLLCSGHKLAVRGGELSLVNYRAQVLPLIAATATYT